jgi:hypothetical protein
VWVPGTSLKGVINLVFICKTLGGLSSFVKFMQGLPKYHLTIKKRLNEFCRFKLPENEKTASCNISVVDLWKKES